MYSGRDLDCGRPGLAGGLGPATRYSETHTAIASCLPVSNNGFVLQDSTEESLICRARATDVYLSVGSPP